MMINNRNLSEAHETKMEVVRKNSSSPTLRKPTLQPRRRNHRPHRFYKFKSSSSSSCAVSPRSSELMIMLSPSHCSSTLFPDMNVSRPRVNHGTSVSLFQMTKEFGSLRGSCSAGDCQVLPPRKSLMMSDKGILDSSRTAASNFAKADAEDPLHKQLSLKDLSISSKKRHEENPPKKEPPATKAFKTPLNSNRNCSNLSSPPPPPPPVAHRSSVVFITVTAPVCPHLQLPDDF